MKRNPNAAILLLVGGLIALGYQGFAYSAREKVVEVGAFRILAEGSRTIPLPPIIGVALVGAGVFLMVKGRHEV